jgi:hypothetical protein
MADGGAAIPKRCEAAAAMNNWHVLPAGPLVPLEFDVVAGRVIYLGNLNARVAAGRNLFGQRTANDGVGEVRDRRTVDIPLMEARYPTLKGKSVVALLPLGIWGNDETMKRLDPPIVAPIPKK